MIRLVASAIAFVLLAGSLVGCENTVSGFGKDMQSNGKSIERSANE